MVLFACPQEDAQPCVNQRWAVSSRDEAGWGVGGEEGGSNFPLVQGGDADHLLRALPGAEHSCPCSGAQHSPSAGFQTHLDGANSAHGALAGERVGVSLAPWGCGGPGWLWELL